MNDWIPFTIALSHADYEHLGEMVDLSASYSCVSIRIENENSSYVVMADSPIAYRFNLEEVVPDSLAQLFNGTTKAWPFWEIVNSSWIDDRQQVGGLIHYKNAKHLAVLVENALIEILTEGSFRVIREKASSD